MSGLNGSISKLTLAILLATGLTLPGVATDAHAWGKGGYDRHEAKMMEKLDLSEEQKKELEKIRGADKEKQKALRENLRKTREKFETALRSNASKDELRKLHGELQKLRNEKGELHFEKILSIREVLTPEQRAKLGDMKEKRKSYKGKKGKKGKRHAHGDDDA